MTPATASAHSVRFILNTALWLTALGLVVRASGAVKEIVFAGAFGVSAATDAFVVAVTYSTLAPTVIGAAVGTALIAHRRAPIVTAHTQPARCGSRTVRSAQGSWRPAWRVRRRSTCSPPSRSRGYSASKATGSPMP